MSKGTEILKLREARGAAADKARAIVDGSRARGDLILSEEDEKEFETLKQRMTSLEREIAREEELMAIEASLDMPLSEPPRVTVMRDEADRRAGVTGPFGSLGEQLLAVYQSSMPGRATDPRLFAVASGMNETVPSDGGFLVQKDFVAGLVQRAYQTGRLINLVRRIPISANANGVKFNVLDETSRVDGSRLGGIQTYWTNEADLKLASRPKFRQMELTLKKLTGLLYATDELLQDAVALENMIGDWFAEEFAFRLDDAILNGTGVGQPLGILNSSALVTVAKESGQGAATVLFQNILNMRVRLWASSRANAVWLVNSDIEPALQTMSMTVGTGGVPVWMPASGISTEGYDTLFGRPVIPIEQLPTLGTKGDILLADMSQYVMIDKGGLQSASSIHVRFIYDETTFRFVYRVDGQPLWSVALTPAHGSLTRSPFVTLETR